MQFLKKFWQGNITPGETRYRHDAAYSEALRTMEQSETQLKQVLSAEDWHLFRQFADAAQKISAIADCDSFVDGFSLGAKMMMDVLQEP